MTINGYDPAALLKRTAAEIWKDNVLGLSAQAAYSFFFSLFPILLFLTPLFNLIGNEGEVINRILTRLSVTIPPEAYNLLRGIVRDVVMGENAPGLVSVGLLLAVFSGSAMIDTLMGALNRAYDANDPRPWWKKRLIAMGLTLGAAVTLGTATMVMFAGESMVGFLAGIFGLSGDTQRVWTVIQYPMALVVLTGFLWLLYYLLPYVEQKKSHVLVGAVFTVILWVLITIGFRFYVANIGSYNKTYGTIGGVIILLTWMYLTMLAVLAGGELNSELRNGTGKMEKCRSNPLPTHCAMRLSPRRIASRKTNE
ncbi:MAG: YihY/virulence factor BrkB family protein [Gemmatimonadaceae bacterium]|nr:YihY/virulence factor BrkB family protein [Gemmatimonadaceae bacterium]